MTLLREPEYFEQATVQLIDQDHRQDAIEAVKRNVNMLEKQEENLAWAIRNMDDATGAGRLVADYQAVVQDRQSAEEEVARLEQENVEYRAATEQLQAVKTLLYGITQSGKSFTYEKKRSILYMLNVRVMVYPHRSEPRYTVAVGKRGNVRLLLKSGDYDLAV